MNKKLFILLLSDYPRILSGMYELEKEARALKNTFGRDKSHLDCVPSSMEFFKWDNHKNYILLSG